MAGYKQPVAGSPGILIVIVPTVRVSTWLTLSTENAAARPLSSICFPYSLFHPSNLEWWVSVPTAADVLIPVVITCNTHTRVRVLLTRWRCCSRTRIPDIESRAWEYSNHQNRSILRLRKPSACVCMCVCVCVYTCGLVCAMRVCCVCRHVQTRVDMLPGLG